jgi:hypothetical protein
MHRTVGRGLCPAPSWSLRLVSQVGLTDCGDNKRFGLPRQLGSDRAARSRERTAKVEQEDGKALLLLNGLMVGWRREWDSFIPSPPRETHGPGPPSYQRDSVRPASPACGQRALLDRPPNGRQLQGDDGPCIRHLVQHYALSLAPRDPTRCQCRTNRQSSGRCRNATCRSAPPGAPSGQCRDALRGESR